MFCFLVKFIDDLILGSSLSKNPNKNLTPTARSVGLVVLIDSLRKPGESVWGENDTTNAFKFMQDFFRRRVMLQRALGKYIDARSRIREYRAGRIYCNALTVLSSVIRNSTATWCCSVAFVPQEQKKLSQRTLPRWRS